MVAVQHERGSRNRILAAAGALFTSRGFHQTSMAELASAAQVSVGQIYRIFKGKEEVIAAIVHADAEAREAELAAVRRKLDAGELNIEQTFEQLLLHIIDEKDEALSFDILAESFRNDAVGTTIGTMCLGIRQHIRDFARAANSNLSGEALDGAEDMILACMFGLGHRSLSQPKLSAAVTARRSGQMIVAALKATA